MVNSLVCKIGRTVESVTFEEYKSCLKLFTHKILSHWIKQNVEFLTSGKLRQYRGNEEKTHQTVLKYSNEKVLATIDVAYLEDVRHKKSKQEDLDIITRVQTYSNTSREQILDREDNELLCTC